MLQFVLQKSLYGLSLLFGVVSVVFFLFALNPADPARMMAGQFADAETLEGIREAYGLDKPVLERYGLYLEKLSPVSFNDGIALKSPDLGVSYNNARPVSEILAETIPNSLLLAGGAIGLALILGVVLGMVSAQNKDKPLDRFIISVSALGMAGPSFFVGMLVAWLFGFRWSQEIYLPWIVLILLVGVIAWMVKPPTNRVIHVIGFLLAVTGTIFYDYGLTLPGTGLPMSGSWREIHPFLGETIAPQHLILPLLTLGVRPLAVITQLTRNALLDVLSQDYVRTAKAKGLSQRRVLWVHALPMALNPVITAASGWFAGMLAGAVFVEFIFGWRGLGLELFEALQREDQPVVMGAVLFFAAFFVLINILVDVCYAWLDPRIRLKNS